MINITQSEIAKIFDFQDTKKSRYLNWIDNLDFLLQVQLGAYYNNEGGIRRRNNKNLTYTDSLCKSTYLDDRLGNYVFIYELGSANVSVTADMFLVTQSLRLVIVTTCDNISELAFGLVRFLKDQNIESFSVNTNKEVAYSELTNKEKTMNNAVNLAYIDFSFDYYTDYDCTEYTCKKC